MAASALSNGDPGREVKALEATRQSANLKAPGFWGTFQGQKSQSESVAVFDAKTIIECKECDAQ